MFRDVTEAKRAESSWRLLAQVSATLSSSLDYHATPRAVAQIVVPHLADWCAVELLDDDGTLAPVAVAHADPARVALAEDLLRRWPPSAADRTGVGAVVRTGVPRMVREVTDQMLAAGIEDPERLRAVRALGVRSFIAVPIQVEGRPIGAMSFTSAESGRRFDAQDQIVAGEVARRVALAIENARAYREARRAVEVRDTFLSIASHELKTPLTSLSMAVGGLLRAARQHRLRDLPEDQVVTRLERVEQQADRMAQLVNQLLDVSRLSMGRLTLDRSEVDLTALVREVLTRFDEVAASAGCALEVSLADQVTGRWDRSRLDQVLANLITNALKYGPGRPVQVTLTADACDATLRVRDAGPGIAVEDQRRIFQQFERAAPPGYGGLGLGPWIVRHIVEMHGGTVGVESAPGQGACFTVVLPR